LTTGEPDLERTMRVAAISDIHGNRFALDAALADVEKHAIDKIVCLGDTVQGGPQPVETVERLRKLGSPVVLGNADAWLLNEEADSAEPTSEEQREVRAWTISKLSRADLDFLRSYKPTVEIKLDGGQRLLCFHGSPTSYDDILLPDSPKERWDQLLGPYSPAIMAGGHTHTQQVRRIRGGLFFNPGSVGVAYDVWLPKEEFRTEPWAEYAILSFEDGYSSLEFRRAYYDLEGLIQTIESSGRPHADHMISDYMKGR
jgi:putative phosphoesterase